MCNNDFGIFNIIDTCCLIVVLEAHNYVISIFSLPSVNN